MTKTKQHRLLVIEDEDIAETSSVHAVVKRESEYDCERLAWRRLGSGCLLDRGIDLVVAVAGQTSPTLTSALDWLVHQKTAAFTLAVLPERAQEPLVRSVLAVADDFMFSPVRPVEVRHRLQRILGEARTERNAVYERLIEEMTVAKLVGRDPVFLQAVEQVPCFARTDAPILISGETGTGKELCARALHQLGNRSNLPFVAVDCGSIPESLFESELFGHTRGAFTGADREHKGLVAFAEGGTFFLDEIDALSLAAQAKLLRFLQEHTYRPVGSERSRSADVRVIAASNRDLRQSVAEKKFRADLYFRLDILHIHLPPLRVRVGDVELLAQSILDEINGSNAGPPKSFTRAALHALAAYSWPGNIRELNNVIQRAALTSGDARILASDLQFQSRPPAINDTFAPAESSTSFRTARQAAMAAFERHYVEELLRKHGGNVTHAAREAQQDRRAFGRLIKKHQIDRSAL